MQTIFALFAAALVFITISLRRTYYHVPPKELKRRARNGDDIAAALYKAVSYGHTLGAVLWFLIGTSCAVFFTIVAATQPAPIALILIAAVIWIGFVYLPDRDTSRYSVWLARRIAPPLASTLSYLHPLLDKLIHLINRNRPLTIHTGLYDQRDLIDLLERQQVQADNRIDQFELEIARHALQFGDLLVRQYLTPRRVVKAVDANETIGPVLMTELHDSGHSRFPVYEGKSDNMIGVLFIRDLVKAKTGGRVHGTMQPGVCYIHEEASLAEALQAILKTRQHLFIVVNSFEEYVGILTIEDVLEQIVGKPIVDEFDQYEDMRSVAARFAAMDHTAHQKVIPEPTVTKDETTT